MLKKSTLLFLSVCLLLAFSVSPVEAAKEQCKNNVDDNDDGLVDCADPDCASKSFCGGGNNDGLTPFQVHLSGASF